MSLSDIEKLRPENFDPKWVLLDIRKTNISTSIIIAISIIVFSFLIVVTYLD